LGIAVQQAKLAKLLRDDEEDLESVISASSIEHINAFFLNKAFPLN
jgi:hypothetical protein